MHAIGNEHFIILVEVSADGPAGGDSVLVVSEDIFDPQYHACRLRLNRNNPPRLPLANDVGQIDGQEPAGPKLCACEPEIALQGPGNRVLLPGSRHQVKRPPVVCPLRAKDDVANAREESAAPVNWL